MNNNQHPKKSKYCCLKYFSFSLILLIIVLLLISYGFARDAAAKNAYAVSGGRSDLKTEGISFDSCGKLPNSPKWLPRWKFKYRNRNGKEGRMYLSIISPNGEWFSDTIPIDIPKNNSKHLLKEDLDAAYREYLQHEKPNRAKLFARLISQLDLYSRKAPITHSKMIEYLGEPDHSFSNLTNTDYAEQGVVYFYNRFDVKDWLVHIEVTNKVVKNVGYCPSKGSIWENIKK